MKSTKTAPEAHATERQKAWARLALLTVVGLVCPPLAAAKSGFIWGAYLLLVVLYSLWTVRITRSSSRDGQLGYLLCAADAAALVPIMVWSLGVAMPLVLSLLWVIGAATTWSSARAHPLASNAAPRVSRSRVSARARRDVERVVGSTDGAPLERALRVRLKVLREEGTRFALVVLKLSGFEAMITESGKEATKEFLQQAGERSLRLMGPDAQLFPLPGGRMAFVFATEAGQPALSPVQSQGSLGIGTHDVEGLAMALAAKACDRSLGGHRLECVVGWASAPADGNNVDDLMYAAESGALSTAAFRRVGGPRLAVPRTEKKRAIAS